MNVSERLARSEVPEWLHEVMEKFFRDNSPESLEQWRKQPMDQAIYEDPFQGMRLRNGLGLWLKECPLRDRFWENYQIVHADDVSAAILQTIWRVLNGERHQIEKYAASCREYWASKGYAPGEEMSIADLPAEQGPAKQDQPDEQSEGFADLDAELWNEWLEQMKIPARLLRPGCPSREDMLAQKKKEVWAKMKRLYETYR